MRRRSGRAFRSSTSLQCSRSYVRFNPSRKTTSHTMESTKMRIVHALLSKLEWTEYKDKIVASFSSTGSNSMTALDNLSANKLIAHLQGEEQRMNQKMRAKIIYLMCLLGYVSGNTNQPNYPTINDWLATKLGDNNPKKHTLSQMTCSELHAAIKVIEQRAVNQGVYKRPDRHSRKERSDS